MMATKHVDLKDVEMYEQDGSYTAEINSVGQKRNFRKACKNFSIVDGHLIFKNSRRVIFKKDRKTMIIHDTHEGLNDNPESIALSGHRGRDSTQKKIAERFYWHGIVEDVKNYINVCKKCQQHGKIEKKNHLSFKAFP